MKILSNIFRCSVLSYVLVWWFGRGLFEIITLNYIEIPMIKKTQNTDITFVASIFGSALYSFGLQTNNGNKGNTKPVDCPMAKKKEE